MWCMVLVDVFVCVYVISDGGMYQGVVVGVVGWVGEVGSGYGGVEYICWMLLVLKRFKCIIDWDV